MSKQITKFQWVQLKRVIIFKKLRSIFRFFAGEDVCPSQEIENLVNLFFFANMLKHAFAP